MSRISFDSNRTGNFELFTMNADGSDAQRLTTDPAFDSFWPKPSPDRTQIMFVRTPAGVHDSDYSRASIWIMNADGRGLRQLIALGAFGWTIQAHPEWRPDGERIAIIGGANANPQIFLVNADGTNPVRVTSNGRGGPRAGINIDPSWHPDGQSLLFVGCALALCTASNYEVYRINADGSGETRLTNDSVPDYDPYFSPASTGSAGLIAWLRNTAPPLRFAIFRMNFNGSDQRPIIDDGGINSKPGWALDSSVIYFHRIPPAGPPGSVFNVWRIRPDGTALTEVITPRPAYVNEYPVNGIN